MRGMAAVRALAAALALAIVAPWTEAQPVRGSEDWADSPEAYFLTAEEHAEWKALDSRDTRHAFQERYWLKRDPTPGTEKTSSGSSLWRGSRSPTSASRSRRPRAPGRARGFVFIVFGSPARIEDVHGQPTTSSRAPVGSLEATETISRWIYDQERTPRVLEALERASLEIEIILEPTRHSDAIQSPGLVNELRERLARKTSSTRT